MKALLLSTVYGILAFNEVNEPIAKCLSEKTPQQLSDLYLKLHKGEKLPEILDFLKSIEAQHISEIEIEDPRLTGVLSILEGIKCTLQDDPFRLKKIRNQLFNHYKTLNIETSFEKIAERTKVLSEFMIKAQVAEFSARHDLAVKQCVDTISDVNKSINLIATRLREWYGLHFPEFTDKLISDNIVFAGIVAKLGTRDHFTKENLIAELQMKEDKAEFLANKALRSMGGTLTPPDIAIIQSLAKNVLELVAFRDEMEKYLGDILQEVAPNLQAILGTPVASQLIALAGSLERLAEFPSSTIQLLGAEKALFKALKFGAKTPKHGIIFQWHKIRSEKAYLRGKISRMVAGKISICAKVDYYKGQFIGEQMAKEIDVKIELIKKTFPNAPEKKASEKQERPKYGGDRRGGGKPGRERRGGERHDGDRHSGERRGGERHGGERRGTERHDGERRGAERHGGESRGEERRGGSDRHGDRWGGQEHHKEQGGFSDNKDFSRKKKEKGKKGGDKGHFKQKKQGGMV